MRLGAHLILVTGHPASGKSYLAHRLARDLAIPVLQRDAFKEVLFDTIGAPDISMSKALGKASYDLLHTAAQALLAQDLDVILDANYAVDPGQKEVTSLLKTYGASSMELLLHAPLPVLATRYQKRLQDGSRHPGHHDAERLGEFMDRIRTPYQPLNLGGPVLRVDTSLPDSAYYPDLLEQIRIWRDMGRVSQ